MAPENVIRIDSPLDLKQAVVVRTPEGALPIRFSRIVLFLKLVTVYTIIEAERKRKRKQKKKKKKKKKIERERQHTPH